MFTVYKVINRLNGKYYIGVHKTENPNDGYLGSGRAIRAAIKNHGRANFEKIVLFGFADAADAYAKEVELTHDFHISGTYNMRRGGVGGFTREVALRGVAAAILAGAPSKGGRASAERKSGVMAWTAEQRAESGRRGGLANKGKSKTPEHIAKLQVKCRLSPEQYAANGRQGGLKRKGKKLSPETRAKLSAAARRYWEAKSKSGDRPLITV